MSTIDIHGTTNRIIAPEAIAWAREKILPRIAARDAERHTRWHGRFVDALRQLEREPVRCERLPDGSYHAAFRSSRDAHVEYYADAENCTCQGCLGHTVKNPRTGMKELVVGYCWHRAACILLPRFDRWEQHQMRKQFRIRYSGGAFTLLYKDVPVAGVVFNVFDEAVEHVAHCIELAYA